MKKIKPDLQDVDLENIPKILQTATALIQRELKSLTLKDSLSSEETKNMIAMVTTLSAIYKEYKAEVIAIKKELKEMPKEELHALINAEGAN